MGGSTAHLLLCGHHPAGRRQLSEERTAALLRGSSVFYRDALPQTARTRQASATTPHEGEAYSSLVRLR